MRKYEKVKRVLVLLLAAVLTFQSVGELSMPDVMAAEQQAEPENVEEAASGENEETVGEPEKKPEGENEEEPEETPENGNEEKPEETPGDENEKEPEETPGDENEETPEETPGNENEETPEITPEETLPEAVKDKIREKERTASEDEEPKEYFYDTSEIALQIVDGTFQAMDKNNGNLTVVENGRQYNLTSNPFYSIKKLSFQLEFTIKKDDETRQLKEGDTLTIAIPQVLAIAQDTTDRKITKEGLLIGTYEITPENELVITFTENVDYGKKHYSEIAGGLKLELNVDSETLKNLDKEQILIQERGEDEPEITVKFPELSDEVSGISKQGKVNSSDHTIQWTIQVGTDENCKGADLSGIKLEETFGEGQTFVTAYAGDGVNGTAIQPDEDGNLPLAGLGLKAPATVTVVTAVTKTALEAATKTEKGSFLVENTVEIKAADESAKIDENNVKADAAVTVYTKGGVSKKGVQLDSHTIQWTICVNENPQLTLYEGIVTDELSEGLSYKEGSFHYQIDGGEKIACDPVTTDEKKEHQLLKKTENGKQTLLFRLKDETANKYTLTFQTEVADGYTAENDEVMNAVSVDSRIPYWTNEGTAYLPVTNATPGVGVEFFQAKLNKSVKADQEKVSGQLTWTLEPSTRIETGEYNTAVLTDTIDTDQEYCEKSLKIYYKGKAVLSYDENGELSAGSEIRKIFTWTYETDEAGNIRTLVFTFHKDEIIETSTYSTNLRDYKIEYQTTALNYLHSNNEWHSYLNKATLQIKKGDEVVAENSSEVRAALTSKWISKSTKFEYDGNGKPYFHYTICVNENNVKDLTNVVIEDDITNAIRFQKDGKVSSDWKIDTEKTTVSSEDGKVKISGDRKKFVCEFDELSEKVQIDLYITYTGEKSELTKGIYQNEILYSYNEAGIRSDQISDETRADKYIVAISDSKGSQVFDNTLVKKGEGAVFNENGAKIWWQILVNPNSGEMGTITISDTIAKSQKYIQDSVKLYQAKFTEGSSAITLGDQIQPESIKFDVSETSRTMQVIVSAGDQPVFLEYQTGIVDSVTVAENDVFVKESTWEYGNAKARAWLSGSNWGTLKSVGNVKLQKYDATAGVSIPLAGAEITLYADDAGKDKVDIGITDENGIVEFKGLDVPLTSDSQTYYYRETKAPDGYTADPGIHPIEVSRGMTKTVEVDNVRETLKTSVVKMTKKFYYTDQDGERTKASEQTAKFKLTFYPYGEGNLGTRKAVELSGEDGSYHYESTNTRQATVLTNAADGTIMISDLPWGYYGIQELSSAEGFQADLTEKYFEISKDTMEVRYQFGTNAAKNNAVMVNEATKLYIVKRAEETGEVIEDILFTIVDENGDVVEDKFNEDKPYEWKSTDEKEQIDNLPAGEYGLHEENTDSDDDLKFTVGVDGEITVDEDSVKDLTSVTVKDSTIEIIDGSKPVQVVKVRDWIEEEQRPTDDEFEPFPGVKFILKGKFLSGEDEREYITDEDGMFTLRYLLIDGEEYQLIEDTPVGYEDLEIDTVFVYEADYGARLKEGAYDTMLVSEEDGDLEVANLSKQNTALQFIVYNGKTRKGISGVGFELDGTNSGTQTIVSAKEGDTTTYETPGEEKKHVLQEGEVFAPNLPAGDYTLTQTTVPKGFTESKEPLSIKFTIGEDEQNTIIKIDEDAIKSGKYGIKVVSGDPDHLFELEPVKKHSETVQEPESEIVVQEVSPVEKPGVLPKTSREDYGSYYLAGGMLLFFGVHFYLEDKKRRRY